MTKKLYEVDHPYYMTQGCYFSNECHNFYNSWEEFLEEWGDAELDYNWIIRWDWVTPDPEDYDDSYPNPFKEGEASFKIQFFHQRKAYPTSNEVKVHVDQEPMIREYLKKYWEYMKEMWEPYSNG